MNEEKQEKLRDKEKIEADPVQDYFYWNSDSKLLIDGLPLDVYNKLQEKKDEQHSKI